MTRQPAQYRAARRRRAMVTTSMFVVSAAAVVASRCGPGPGRTTMRPGPSRLVVRDCGLGPSVRPTSIAVSCTNGGEIVEHLTWTSWSTAGAHATGTMVINSCGPCVTVATGPGTIDLTDPVFGPDGALYFSLATYTYDIPTFGGSDGLHPDTVPMEIGPPPTFG